MDFGKKWEGRVVDGKFPLRQRLGGSDHSAVFLTERAGKQPGKAAIKLIPAPSPGQPSMDETAQLSRWAGAARLSRPHLIALYEWGRCQIGDTRLLYVVMEYAEENLAEIIPLRALSSEEAAQMLQPTAEALASLHQAAVGDQLKISADALHKTGERGEPGPASVYEAPEVATGGLTPASDIWSLGATLVAVLTQSEPKLNSGGRGAVTVSETIPQPLHEIVSGCLKVDPQQRLTVAKILSRIQPSTPPIQPAVRVKTAAPLIPEERPKRWILPAVVVAVLLLVIVAGIRFMGHQTQTPAVQTSPTTQAPVAPAERTAAPFSEKKPAQTGTVRGSVLQQVLPDISRSAQNTITGRLKVSIRVDADASGNVSQAKFVSPGPSRYFAGHALDAARRWKFTPPQVNGEAVPSEWLLKFQFGRNSIQVSPAETRP
jgi:eukaryotic-like serine/threonine-protein kinase